MNPEISSTYHNKGLVVLTVHAHQVYHWDRLLLFSVPGTHSNGMWQVGVPAKQTLKGNEHAGGC